MIDTAMSRMFESDVRIERAIWLPGAVCDTESPSSDFCEFCEDFTDNENDKLFLGLPFLRDFATSDDPLDATEVAEAIAGRAIDGFLFQAATPVRKYIGGGSWLSGWGVFRTQWLYASTIDLMEQAAIAWAEGRHKKDEADAALPLAHGEQGE